MTFSKTTSTMAASAVALVALAGSASAATTTFGVGDQDLTVGERVLVNTTLNAGGDTEEVEFTAQERLRIAGFSLTGNGFNDGEDLMKVVFNWTRMDGSVQTGSFTSDEINQGPGGTSAALDFLDGFDLAAGEMFTLGYGYEGGAENVDVDASFTTAAVPVPAAGGLLLGALGVGGFVARRKKKAA